MSHVHKLLPIAFVLITFQRAMQPDCLKCACFLCQLDEKAYINLRIGPLARHHPFGAISNLFPEETICKTKDIGIFDVNILRLRTDQGRLDHPHSHDGSHLDHFRSFSSTWGVDQKKLDKASCRNSHYAKEKKYRLIPVSARKGYIGENTCGSNEKSLSDSSNQKASRKISSE